MCQSTSQIEWNRSRVIGLFTVGMAVAHYKIEDSNIMMMFVDSLTVAFS